MKNPNLLSRRQPTPLTVFLAAILVAVCGFARAAVITFNAPANFSADTDVKSGGGNQLFAYTWGTAATVNGLPFTATAVNNGLVGQNLILTTFGTANATVFGVGATPFAALSSAYTNILRGSVFNGTASTYGNAILTNLVPGRTYLVQLWVGDARGLAVATNRAVDVSSGGTPVTLYFNSTLAAGGVGQHTYGTFTADSTTQDILVDGSTITTPWSGLPQINAIQLRDITGVWSGTTSGNWDDNDNSSQNFSGQNYVGVKAVTSDVHFGDKDAAGAAVATSTITVGTGGVTGANANFNNSAVNYTLNSADATGITGAYGVTLNGSGTVTLNGANTYSGNTTINAGTLVLGLPGSIGSSAVVVLHGGTLDCSGLTSLTLGSGQTLRGTGTIRGSVTAASGSTLIPGGAGIAGTLTITNDLTVNGQTMTFDLNFAPSGGDRIDVGDVLTVNSTCTISLNYLFGSLAGGTYTLMTYGSKVGAGTFVLDTAYPGVTLNVNPTSVTLTVGGGSGTSGVWTNLVGSSWGTAANWLGSVIATNVDGIADFSTLNITAPTTVTINGNKTIGHLIFGDTVQSHNWTLSTGTNILAATGKPNIIVNSGQNTTISASLQGGQGFNKRGSGTLTLTGANRLTNAVNVLGGTLALSVANPFGPTTNAGMVPLTLSNTVMSVTVATALTNNLIIPSGTSNYISTIANTAGFHGSGAGPISGGGILTINAAGNNPRLNGGANHNFTGTLIVNGTGAGGMLFAFDESSVSPSYGYAGSSNAVYELNGGASSLCYMGTSDWAAGGRAGCTNYLGELRGSARLSSNNGRSGSTTLEIGGKNTDSTFSGIIRDNNSGSAATPMIIRKVGTGTLTLAGNSTYTGATEARNGTLAVSGALGVSPITVFSGGTFQLDGAIGSTNVNVNSGGRFVVGPAANLGSAPISLSGTLDTTPTGGSFSLGSATLSGSGVVTGSLALASSSINPGAIGAAGTLTITNGNFSATGGTLQFDLSNTPGSGNDQLDVNGNLDFSTPGVVVNINKLSGSLGAGTYVLAKCNGTASGSAGNLTLVNAGPLDYLQLTSTELQLIVSPVTSLIWKGDGIGNLWDIGVSTTWMNVASPATYAEGNAVTFNNAGATNPVVDIPGVVNPAVVSVAGNSNYTFVGTGGIGDGASLVKTGNGTLTVLNTNDFTGTVFVSGGTLAVGNAGTNGQLSADITNSAALVITTPQDQVMTNTMRGTGSFTKSGPGQLILTGESTMTGPTTISAGTLSLGDGISGGGSLGTGNVTNNALLVVNRASTATLNSPIRNQGGMVNQGAGTVVLSGVISGNGALTNTGALELNANNTFAGTTYINSGTVMLRNFAGFGTGDVIIDDAGGGAVLVSPSSGGTNVLANSIKLPTQNMPQFVVTDLSLTSMGTVRLTGLISGGGFGTDTRIVNGGGTPAGNPRLTIVLENAANNFTMNPDVYSGCLAFTSDGALGDANNDIVVRATANFPGTGFTDATDLVGLRFDANNITLNASRSINLVGNERINVQGFNGTIAGDVTGLGLNKRGTGTLTLNGTGLLTGQTAVNVGTLLVNNTWAAPGGLTVASGATLGGNGTINGTVSIASGGALTPGTSIGTLTVTNQLTLAAGSTTTMEINAGSLTCDKVVGITTLNYNGTLTVTNTGGAFAIGQSYQLFGANSYSGNFAATNLPTLGISGAHWDWNPANGTLSIAADVTVNQTPTNITSVISGSNLELSWPPDHIGWRLEVQTNSVNVGIANNWSNWPGANLTNFISVPINPANPTVFFRMVYP